MPRTSSRFAIFAHAIKSTSPGDPHQQMKVRRIVLLQGLDTRATRRQHHMHLRQCLLALLRREHLLLPQTPAAAPRSLSPATAERHSRLHPPNDVKPVRLGIVDIGQHSPAPASSRSAGRNPVACSSNGHHKILAAQSPRPSPVWCSPRTSQPITAASPANSRCHVS